MAKSVACMHTNPNLSPVAIAGVRVFIKENKTMTKGFGRSNAKNKPLNNRLWVSKYDLFNLFSVAVDTDENLYLLTLPIYKTLESLSKNSDLEIIFVRYVHNKTNVNPDFVGIPDLIKGRTFHNKKYPAETLLEIESTREHLKITPEKIFKLSEEYQYAPSRIIDLLDADFMSDTVKRVLKNLEMKQIDKTHSFHSSPREHERRGHWRHYKSGKRVWVREATVNAGKKKILTNPHIFPSPSPLASSKGVLLCLGCNYANECFNAIWGDSVDSRSGIGAWGSEVNYM